MKTWFAFLCLLLIAVVGRAGERIQLPRECAIILPESVEWVVLPTEVNASVLFTAKSADQKMVVTVACEDVAPTTEIDRKKFLAGRYAGLKAGGFSMTSAVQKNFGSLPAYLLTEKGQSNQIQVTQHTWVIFASKITYVLAAALLGDEISERDVRIASAFLSGFRLDSGEELAAKDGTTAKPLVTADAETIVEIARKAALNKYPDQGPLKLVNARYEIAGTLAGSIYVSFKSGAVSEGIPSTADRTKQTSTRGYSIDVSLDPSGKVVSVMKSDFSVFSYSTSKREKRGNAPAQNEPGQQ